MNIVMVTNTYAPHVGGVARSVAAFSHEYRRRGNRVLVVAPEFLDVVKADQSAHGVTDHVDLLHPGLTQDRLNLPMNEKC